MTTDTGSLRSRRAILGAAIGGAAAVAATAAVPLTALASTGDGTAANLGEANTSNTVTSFENLDDGEASLAGVHSATGTAVTGTSVTGSGVDGWSSDTTPSTWADPSHRTGVIGAVGDRTTAPANTDEVGVHGYAAVSPGSAGVWGHSVDGAGVVGTGVSDVSTGVYAAGDWGVYATGFVGVVGDVSAPGVGVLGFVGAGTLPTPPSTGVGVYAYAESTTQFALQVRGKVKLNRSGRTSLGSTATSKTITMTGVTTSSYVVATMQTNVSGVYVRAVVPAAGSFKIYLSKAAGKTVWVGYVVIN